MLDLLCKVCDAHYVRTARLAPKSKYCSKACMQSVNPGGFTVGQPAWNKGKNYSAETREKISLAQIGRKKSEESKNKQRQKMLGRKITWADKISKAHMGKKGLRGVLASNWQGGKTPELKQLRNSTEYATWRKAVFERDDYTCQNCFQKGGILNADHIKAFAHYPELRFDISNGRTLCIDCHKSTDNYGWKGRRYA